MTDPVTAAEVRAFLPDTSWHLVAMPTVDSTNTFLRRMAAAGAPDRTVLIAGSQMAGRGQRGRTFFSPAGSGLYMSVLLRPALSPERLSALTPLVAVAVAEALEALSGRPVGIKWVNDIYMDGRKVCGILTESAVADGRTDHVVIGIGVDLAPPEGGFPLELAAVAGTVTDGGEDLRAAAAAAILTRLDRLLRRLPKKAWLAPYRRRSVLTGRRVNVMAGERTFEATVRGIDRDGGLIVRTAAGREILRAGEVTVRPQKAFDTTEELC